MAMTHTQQQALHYLKHAHDPKALEIAIYNTAQGTHPTQWRREVTKTLLEALHLVGTTPHLHTTIEHIEKELNK